MGFQVMPVVVAHGRCTGIDPEMATEMYASVANAVVRA